MTDRDSDTFYCPVFGVQPIRYDATRDVEKAELDHERISLWYVAATRARELLVFRRLDAAQPKSGWISPLDLPLADLPMVGLSHLPLELNLAAGGATNDQTRDGSAAEAASIVARQRRSVWFAPGRDECTAGPILTPEAVERSSTPTRARSSPATPPPARAAGSGDRHQHGRLRRMARHHLR